MKKGFLIFLIFFNFLSSLSQEKAPVKKIDTVKTEVVEVITTYNPEIADANKIKKNPVIELSEKSKKKKLSYTIFSAPVASTFIPKSGVVKGIDVGVKERIYNNYLAAGFGNYTSPYFEAYIHNHSRFQSEFGLSTKYTGSLDNIENTLLNSNFSNLATSIFYKREERYFDWKVTLNSERKEYNWYGLKENTFTDNVVNAINENQRYNYFSFKGEIDFLDAYINKSSIAFGYFTDGYNSKEILFNLDTDLDLPLDFISRNLDNIKITTSVEFLKGNFESQYGNLNELSHSIFTAKINPQYKTNIAGFSVKLGTKLYASFDSENSVNHFLAFPDIKIQKEIIKDQLNIYTGVFGDFYTNNYKNFTEENPYISPTQFITQTAEKYNIFAGLNGVVNNNLSFNFSGSYKEENDKALFVRNNSKSDGTFSTLNGTDIKGYEFGNSFTIIYDDVKTSSFFAELEYDFTKNITLGTNFQFDNYQMKSQQEAWNLPTVQATLFAEYKSNKWFAKSNIFYVSERKDVIYNSISPSFLSGVQNLNGFIDFNLNGGYHFNDKFSSFLILNNILNKNYQRFANFNVQGFQVLGGVTYKFDF